MAGKAGCETCGTLHEELYLYGIESAVSVQGKANDVSGVLVPASVDRVAHDIARLREDLLDESFVSTQSNPLAKVRGHTHHQAFTGLTLTPLLSLLLPALQLFHHRTQLVIARLLKQQLELLHNPQSSFQGGYRQCTIVSG